MSNKSVLTELRQWANSLPYWEQVVLDKIVEGVHFIDADYEELLQYLLEDTGLSESTTARPKVRFSQSKDSASPSSFRRVRLKSISNLRDVNALVPGQTLTFCPALTAIFGANASGKSGYARLLGCAGFTRGDKEVLPDVTQSIDDSTIPSADIEVSSEVDTKVIHYQTINKCSELEPFYVFDSTSVHVHLCGSNTFSFSPAVLSYLTRLADETDKVREYLKRRIDEYNQTHDFLTLFQGNSAVTDLVANLGTDTDLEKLDQIAKLTSDEKERICKLDISIAKLKFQDIPAKVKKLVQTIKDIEVLTKRLEEARSTLNDEKVKEIQNAVQLYLKRQTAAQRLSIDQFKSEHFTQTGSEVWHQFIEAAKELAEAERGSEKPYPQADDPCLLCQQPLSSKARDFLLRLWTYLEGKAQLELNEAQKVLMKKQEELELIDLDFFDEESVSYRHLLEHNEDLLKQVIAFIESCCKWREDIIEHINALKLKKIPELPDIKISDIEQIVKILKGELKELEKLNPAQEIDRLEKELLSLQHRNILGKHLKQINDYVQKRIWARKATSIAGDTRHITYKYKNLFEKLITERYIQLFEQILRDLQRPLKVKVKTTGRKGETRKQIVLEAEETIPVTSVALEKVLSGGEKRAVALADFLTEVAVDITSAGIILDDPVTSLDLEWREKIASILVKEAKNRQVIIFTHDLPFLYFLKKYADQQQVEIKTHWIKRGENDNKPGYVFLNNSPALEREYRKTTRARVLYEQANAAQPEQQEALLREEFGALRTNYEALIIFDLFKEVIMRFEERISFGRLKDIVWDQSIADKIVEKCELLSKYIEGHLHSDAFTAQKGTPKILLQEIEEFEVVRKSLKKRKTE